MIGRLASRRMSLDKALSVIGTAGRKDDASRMSAYLYELMMRETFRAINDFDIQHGISGGAAWADHCAVTAFLQGALESLTLYIPAEFDGRRFVPDASIQFNPGKTSNYYHDIFSRALNRDTLRDLAVAQQRGARFIVNPGFKNRNSDVARSSAMLCFTFGTSAAAAVDFRPGDAGFSDSRAGGVKDGGSADTWTKATSQAVKRHVNLFRLAEALVA
jgi:hypothetical protein